MAKKTICFVLVCFMLMVGMVLAGQPQKEEAAVKAAEEWLAVLDNGRYEESWDKASTNFQNIRPKEQRVQLLRDEREPLGKVISRKLIKAVYQTGLPGAPELEIVTIRFDTTFENEKPIVEAIQVTLESDGQWRVASYYTQRD